MLPYRAINCRSTNWPPGSWQVGTDQPFAQHVGDLRSGERPIEQRTLRQVVHAHEGQSGDRPANAGPGRTLNRSQTLAARLAIEMQYCDSKLLNILTFGA